MNATDLLANIEREPEERPRPIAPVLPDVETGGRPWFGSATSEVRYWKVRALGAEAQLAALQRIERRRR